MKGKAHFCTVKITTPQNINKTSGIFLVILGTLITLGLSILRYFNIINLGIETILAPTIVSALLIYGDKFLVLVFVEPFSYILKLLKK